MSKIEVSKVCEIIKHEQVAPDVLRRIVEAMNLAIQPEGGEEAAPAIKKQFVILVSDPEAKIPVNDLVGWVLQIPEDESPAVIQERILCSAYDYNATKKGRLFPVSTVGEALENIPAKGFKDAEVWVKTKTPVLVMRTDNKIPKSES